MIICIEGLNGCGKTTIGNLLANKLNCEVLEHPNKLTVPGAACREMVNLSPKKLQQVEAQGDYLELLIERAIKDFNLSYKYADPNKINIWSRCQLSTLAYNFFNLPPDYPSLKKMALFQKIITLPQPDLLIYLDAPAKMCWQRTKTRTDKSRQRSLRYLLNINRNYQKALDVAKTHGWALSTYYLKPHVTAEQTVGAIIYSCPAIAINPRLDKEHTQKIIDKVLETN